MQTIPSDIFEQFSAVLIKRAIPLSSHEDYRKWLRYYLDFRIKYTLPDSRSEHVRMFVQKLREKGQTPEQQKQAARALSIFFESQSKKRSEEGKQNNGKSGSATIQKSPLPLSISPLKGERAEGGNKAGVEQRGGSRFNEWRCLEKSGSSEWDKIIDDLAAEITTRHYSRKTLKTYADWSRKFQSYLKNKPPESLTSADVKAYVSYLAVKCKVAASTQNHITLFKFMWQRKMSSSSEVP